MLNGISDFDLVDYVGGKALLKVAAPAGRQCAIRVFGANQKVVAGK